MQWLFNLASCGQTLAKKVILTISISSDVCEDYDDGNIIGTKNMVQLLVTIIMMMGILKIIKMIKKLARAVKTRPERLSGIYAMSGNSMNSCYSESDVCVHSDSKKFCVAKKAENLSKASLKAHMKLKEE